MKDSDLQTVSDADLAIQGFFSELVRRYTKPIYNFTYRLVGDTQAAEDATQETFIKAWKHLKKYDPHQSFRAWIFTIARNTTTDYMRKKKSVPFSNLTHDDELPFESTLSDENPLPDELFSKIETAESLAVLLDKLSNEYKTVLVLHYQDNLTFDEIGTIMNKPLNTVKSWHRRALLKLRELL